MRYIGSKLKLLDFIEEHVKKYCGEDLHGKVFCDIFAGTGVVGKHFTPMTAKVIANDLENYSFVANFAALRGFDIKKVEGFFNELDSLSEDDAEKLFSSDRNLFDAYSEGGSCGRLFFKESNGKKIQVARNLLSSKRNEYTPEEYMAILASIIDSADKVGNTMSTYGMYASKLEANSLKDIEFVPIKQASGAGKQNEIYKTDANSLIHQIKGDILYLDPPYNSRRYSSYYFPLNAIVENRAPVADTISGVKNDECNKSAYNGKATVAGALEDLIRFADFEWIFLSYNNEGLLPMSEIKAIMQKYGDYFVECREHQRYKADNKRKQAASGTVEYIHVLHKGVFNGGMGDDEIREKYSLPDKLAIPANAEQTHKGDDPRGEMPNVDDFEPVISPMNYMGGKKKLIKDFVTKYFLSDTDCFIDLFCGGATVGVNSPAKRVYFNDSILPLMQMYKYIYDKPVDKCVEYIDETIEKWHLVQDESGAEAYKAFRDNYNKTPLESRHPLELFVLMAFSFNNQIRFAQNKGWKFNVPFGKNRSSFNDTMRKNFINFAAALKCKDCVFFSEDFRNFNLDDDDFWGKNVFVYADPPYLISQATYNNGWGENEELDLLEYLDKCNDMGMRFALSNVIENKGNVNTIITTWAENKGYNVIHLERSYANSYYNRKERESKTDEVLITNYSIDKKK